MNRRINIAITIVVSLYPISTLSLFCMKFYATISRPLTHRADRATIAQTKKAKIREGSNIA